MESWFWRESLFSVKAMAVISEARSLLLANILQKSRTE